MLAGLFLIACLSFGSASAFEAELREWASFKTSYDKKYSDVTEESSRFAIFRENVKKIKDLNAKYNPKTYFAVNHLADMHEAEYKAFVSDFHPPAVVHSKPPAELLNITAIPSELDWRKKGAVTPIMNNGPCGSSPYFSAVASLEGAWKIAGNPLVALSVQQVQDCSTPEGNQGCNGGWMTATFQYVIDAGGLESNASYPYTGGNWGTCHFDKSKVVAKIRSYVNVTTGTGNDAAVTQALTLTPVAAAVDATPTGFQFYKSGIFSGDPNAKCPAVNHGIAIVGYGVQNSVGYYILKNTWGPDWGMNGYMLLERGSNTCGVSCFVSYPVV